MARDRSSGGSPGEEQQFRWTTKTLDELEQFYHDEIAPDRRQQGYDPHSDRPSYQWLADNGYSGLAYALREKHDLTVKEFFVDVVGLGDADDTDNGYTWDVDDDTTRDELVQYIQTLDRRRNFDADTLASKQTRLARVVRIYEDLHGPTDLPARASDRDHQVEEIDRFLTVFDELQRELSSDRAKLRYLTDLRRWYEHLQRRGKAEYNPVATLDEEYDWTVDTGDDRETVVLDADDVRQLYDAATTDEECLVVLAVCGWGLRRSEVASLHYSQFAGLDSDDPHIAFDERKNGPGRVSLIYGVHETEERLIALDDHEAWNGYVFPSAQSASGHVSPDTITNRFRHLAEQSDVYVDGGPATPQYGRRFWYNGYEEAISEIVDVLEIAAEEQGSASAEVVRENYLSDEQERRRVREYMRDYLDDAFGDDMGEIK